MPPMSSLFTSLNSFTRILLLLGDGEEKLKLSGKFLFRVKSVREIDAANAAIGVDLHAESFDVVGTISSSSEI